MEPIIGAGRGNAEQPPAPAHETVELAGTGLLAPRLVAQAPSAASRHPAKPQAARRGGDPVLRLMLARLGFVTVVVLAAVVLIALGHAVVATVEAVLGAGLAAVEILKRLG